MNAYKRYQKAVRGVAKAEFELQQACVHRRVWLAPTIVGAAWTLWSVWASFNISHAWVLGIVTGIIALMWSGIYWDIEINGACPIARKELFEARMELLEASDKLVEDD